MVPDDRAEARVEGGVEELRDGYEGCARRGRDLLRLPEEGRTWESLVGWEGESAGATETGALVWQRTHSPVAPIADSMPVFERMGLSLTLQRESAPDRPKDQGCDCRRRAEMGGRSGDV